MRFVAYVGASVALALGVIARAVHERPNFYSACVYLAQSNACLMILSNVLLLTVALILLGLQRVLYGPLRPIEVEQLYEKAWFAVTETCLAMTIFKEEVGAWFVVMFVALLVGKVWGWIGEGRVEVLEQQPQDNPRLFHARLSTSLAISVLFDLLFLRYSVRTVQHQARPSMMVMFAFEFAVLSVVSLSSFTRYGISLREAAIIQQQKDTYAEERRYQALQERETSQGGGAPSSPRHDQDTSDDDENDIDVPGWEEKGQWIFYLDLATDFVKLVLYVSFFCVLCIFYGMPIHIVRDVALTIRSFYKRLTDFMKYKRATQDMNERYPDATEAEVELSDVCIICRESMQVQPSQLNPDGARGGVPQVRRDDRYRPKKLPCGHVLHLRCLRSWLERQQNCPICRQPVLRQAPASVSAAIQRGQTGLEANQAHIQGAVPGVDHAQGPTHNPNAGDRRNRIRFFNLGPLRLGFGAGADVRALDNELRNHMEQARAVMGPVNLHGNRQATGGSAIPLRPALGGSIGSFQTNFDQIQSQLSNLEQRLLQEIETLRVQSSHLHLLWNLQTELARLRSQATGSRHGTQLNSRSGSGGGAGPQITAATAAPRILSQGPNSTSPSTIPGLALPEGWTLVPLYRTTTGPTTSLATNLPNSSAIQTEIPSRTGPNPGGSAQDHINQNNSHSDADDQAANTYSWQLGQSSGRSNEVLETATESHLKTSNPTTSENQQATEETAPSGLERRDQRSTT